MADFQQIVSNQVNVLQGRLQSALGTDVQIVIDWSTFEQFCSQLSLSLSYEVLTSWGGFLVMGKVVDTIETMIQEYGQIAREEMARKMAQFRIQCIANPPPPRPVGKELTNQEKHKQKLEEAENPTKPTITLQDGALTVYVQLGLGAAGVPDYSFVKERLNALFGVSSQHFRNVLEARIPKTIEEIRKEIGDPNFEVEIVFDWESFTTAGSMDQALSNMGMF